MTDLLVEQKHLVGVELMEGVGRQFEGQLADRSPRFAGRLGERLDRL
ncbi:MAG: hypothetical protein M0C28_18920 [Candidatus Moduliflexus flocculans]|nr:hypothetical protein [Candidatus Moduliflexus flocculans]